MTKRNFFVLCLSVSVFAGLSSCVNFDRSAESSTSGKLKIGIDESYTLMMDSQIFTFESLYTHAEIMPFFKPETEIIQDLINDSIQEAVICRDLTAEEYKYFESKSLMPEATKFALDGLAIVLHPENPDTNFTIAQLQKIFSGTDSLWQQVNPNSKLDKLTVVFDNYKSCNARYIKERFGVENEFPATCFTLQSNAEVIEYVSKNKNAIGIISVSWVSDKDDPNCLTFLNKIKVAGIKDENNPLQNERFYKPVQAYIYDGSYALTRDVFVIRTGLKWTLGTGFASHLAGEKGQLIIKKMGMAPVNQPVRTVRISNN